MQRLLYFVFCGRGEAGNSRNCKTFVCFLQEMIEAKFLFQNGMKNRRTEIG